MVEFGFNFFLDCECCDDMFGYKLCGCDDSDKCERCVVVSNEWDDCDEYSGWYGDWNEFSHG